MQTQKKVVKQYDYIVGIDPGKNTGFAVWDVRNRNFPSLETLLIHQALFKILELNKAYTIRIYIEDARLRKKFFGTSREVLQGAGSIKRDCTIWEDFIKEYGLDAAFVHPHNTKYPVDTFNKIIKQKIKSNEHNRDAALLVFDKSY